MYYIKYIKYLTKFQSFKMNLPEKVIIEINHNTIDDIPLSPIGNDFRIFKKELMIQNTHSNLLLLLLLLFDLVIESSTCQTFITRQLSFQLCTSTPTIPAPDFSRELQKRLQRRNLHIDREKMNMKSLEILIKQGLRADELLNPLRNAIAVATLRYEKKKDQERETIRRDTEIIQKIAWKRLGDCYRYFLF